MFVNISTRKCPALSVLIAEARLTCDPDEKRSSRTPPWINGSATLQLIARHTVKLLAEAHLKYGDQIMIPLLLSSRFAGPENLIPKGVEHFGENRTEVLDGRTCNKVERW